MKRIKALLIALAICISLSFTILADDGEIPTGGKYCSEQTCGDPGEIPTGGRACSDEQNCSESENNAQTSAPNDIWNSVTSIIKALTGQ